MAERACIPSDFKSNEDCVAYLREMWFKHYRVAGELGASKDSRLHYIDAMKAVHDHSGMVIQHGAWIKWGVSARARRVAARRPRILRPSRIRPC